MKQYIITFLTLLSFPCLQAQSLEAGTFSILGKEEVSSNAEIQLTAISGQPFNASEKGDQLVYGFTEIAAAAYEANEITGISLDKNTETLETGKNLRLSATVLPANANNKTVNWNSSDATIATVNESGLVEAVAKGEAIITATTASGIFAAICTVTVKDIDTANEMINGENKVYPRLIEDALYIELQKAQTIYIFNVSGKIQHTVQGQAGINTISAESYPAGIYFIRLKDQTVKIIKK